MLIYLDTMLWDVLYDQKVSPHKIKKVLASRRANLVPGPHVFYEMLRTFQSSDGRALARGRELLSFFGQFIGPDTPCANDNMELLAAEIEGINRGPAAAEMFLNRSQRDEFRNEIDKLASGILDERATKLLAEQKEFASRTRLGQKGLWYARTPIRALLGVNVSKSRPVTMLQARPHAIHFKPILDFGEGHEYQVEVTSFLTLNSRFCSRAPRSLRPTVASGGIVKTTDGMPR
jgi:hypothetical protein